MKYCKKLTFRAARKCRNNRRHCRYGCQRAADGTSPTSRNLSRTTEVIMGME